MFLLCHPPNEFNMWLALSVLLIKVYAVQEASESDESISCRGKFKFAIGMKLVQADGACVSVPVTAQRNKEGQKVRPRTRTRVVEKRKER